MKLKVWAKKKEYNYITSFIPLANIEDLGGCPIFTKTKPWPGLLNVIE